MRHLSGGIRYGILGLITFASVGVFLLVGESYLRRTKKFQNYVERQGLNFIPATLAEHLKEPWLWVYEKNTRLELKKREFTQVHLTNSEGWCGVLPPLSKKKNEFRIIAVGDSFTEGVGDPEALGYVGRLANELSRKKRGTDYLVMNAGIAGSDPVFELQLIKRKLLKYKPDLVLLTMNNTDVNDLVRRGGLDRFNPDGSMKMRGPAGEWLFLRSHLFRAVMIDWLGYNWQLQSPRERARASETAIQDLVRSATAVKELGSEHGFKLLVLVQPHWNEIEAGAMAPEWRLVEEGFRKNQVDYANLTGDFISGIPKSNSLEYYWPIDTHFTPKGYQVFAEAVEKELKKRRYVRD